MTHSHTKPAHATLLFTQPRSPTGVTQQPPAAGEGAALTVQRPEVTSAEDSSRQLGSGYKFYSVTNSTEPQGLLQWRGICSWTHTAHLFLAAHVVYGSWNTAQGPSKKLGQDEGLGPGTSRVRPRSAVVGVQVGE